jgi:glyoxylase-like metal-dependent hydrolase (beta-lactamase superfamily II)
MTDTFEQVADGVFAYHHDWADGLCAIVFGDDGAVAIDGGGDAADGETMAAFMRQHGREPTRLIYTHGHPDHVWGAAALGGGEVFSHELTPEVMRKQVPSWAQRWGVSQEEAAARVSWPTATFGQTMSWYLGGRTIRSIRTPGHSTDGTSYLIEDCRTLIAGDAIATGIVPALNDGDGRTLEMSHRLLLEKGDQIDVLVPGHGPVAHGDEVAACLRWGASYLRGVRTRVKQQLVSGIEDQEALEASCSYAEFVGDRFDSELHHMPQRHATAVVKIISEERTRIPDHANTWDNI